MNQFTEEKVILGFKSNDRTFLKEVYKFLYPVISHFVTRNNGSENDAKDIMQEAVLIIYTKVINSDFVLSSTFLTYFYSIVKNLWKKELRNRKLFHHEIIDEKNIDGPEVHISFEKEFKFNVKYFVFRKHYDSLSEQCKNIIWMVLEKTNYETIAKILKLESSEVVRKLKYRCKEMLIKRIKSDPKYLEICKNE